MFCSLHSLVIFKTFSRDIPVRRVPVCGPIQVVFLISTAHHRIKFEQRKGYHHIVH